MYDSLHFLLYTYNFSFLFIFFTQNLGPLTAYSNSHSKLFQCAVSFTKRKINLNHGMDK